MEHLCEPSHTPAPIFTTTETRIRKPLLFLLANIEALHIILTIFSPSLFNESIVYAVSGTGIIASLDDSGKEQKQVLRAGDWALIPANREHKEVNEGDEEVVWVIVRAPGGIPEVVNLSGWKGEEVK